MTPPMIVYFPVKAPTSTLTVTINEIDIFNYPPFPAFTLLFEHTAKEQLFASGGDG